MEASEAMAEQAVDEPEAEQAEPQGPDVGQRLDDLMDRFTRWEQRQEQQAQQYEPQQEYAPYQNGEQQEMTPEQQAAAEGEYMQYMMQQAAEQAIAPYIERQEEQRRVEEIELLEDEYPELKDGRVARGVVEAADKVARRLGSPQLASEPGFVELVYKARKADQRAADEQPAGSQSPGVQLERAGGVAPPAPEEDEAMRIIKAGTSHGSVFG